MCGLTDAARVAIHHYQLLIFSRSAHPETPMNVHIFPSLQWTTRSFSGADDTTATDLGALGAHYQRCNGCKGRWFSLQCAIEVVHGFVGPRFVTTLFAASALILLSAFIP